MEKFVGKLSILELLGQVKIKFIKSSKVASKSVIKVIVDVIFKGDSFIFKIGGFFLKFRYGIFVGVMLDIFGLEVLGSFE